MRGLLKLTAAAGVLAIAGLVVGCGGVKEAGGSAAPAAADDRRRVSLCDASGGRQFQTGHLPSLQDGPDKEVSFSLLVGRTVLDVYSKLHPAPLSPGERKAANREMEALSRFAACFLLVSLRHFSDFARIALARASSFAASAARPVFFKSVA
jgi:hypothetical protein